MGSGQDRLRSSTLSLQRLDDGSELLSDFSIFIDLILKLLKDFGIYHSCFAGVRHFDDSVLAGSPIQSHAQLNFINMKFIFQVRTRRLKVGAANNRAANCLKNVYWQSFRYLHDLSAVVICIQRHVIDLQEQGKCGVDISDISRLK